MQTFDSLQLRTLLPPRAGPWTYQQMVAALLPPRSQKEAFYFILLAF